MIESRLEGAAAPGGREAPPPRGGVSGRERCPTCGARRRAFAPEGPPAGRRGEPRCHRCGSDLSLLLAVEARADRAQAEALAAYRRGHFRTASLRAAEAAALEACPETLRLLAVSSLRCGEFAGAVAAARRLLQGSSAGGTRG